MMARARKKATKRMPSNVSFFGYVIAINLRGSEMLTNYGAPDQALNLISVLWKSGEAGWWTPSPTSGKCVIPFCMDQSDVMPPMAVPKVPKSDKWISTPTRGA